MTFCLERILDSSPDAIQLSHVRTRVFPVELFAQQRADPEILLLYIQEGPLPHPLIHLTRVV